MVCILFSQIEEIKVDNNIEGLKGFQFLRTPFYFVSEMIFPIHRIPFGSRENQWRIFPDDLSPFPGASPYHFGCCPRRRRKLSATGRAM